MKQTGKQLAARIDRQYYRTLDPYIRIKRFAGIGGLIAGIVYSCWAFSGFGSPQISPGDLSHAHSAWNEHGCENCHLPNVPIRPDAWGGKNIKNVALNNQKCNSTCHTVSDHFADRTDSKVFEKECCSECHREHLGKDFQIANLADQSCTRCHAKIELSALAKTQSPVQKAFNFSQPDGHPSFRHLQNDDPGTIKFSHIQHLRPGQPKSVGDKTVKQFQDVEAIFRDRYSHGQPFELGDLIQLNCSDCHDPDASISGSLASSPLSQTLGSPSKQSNNHRLYQPVNFEKHCMACHNLDGVPHGLGREQTKLAVQKLIPVQQLEFLRKTQSRTELPFSETTSQELAEREGRLAQLLGDESQCKKCHALTPSDSLQIVEASQIPQRWFKHAFFPHGEHSMVACRDCHPQAFASSDAKIDSEKESNQVMIEGIDSCRRCHIQDPHERARQFEAGTARVATADCIDCHRYHVDPPKSKNAEALSSLTQFDIERVRMFLSQGDQR